MATQPQPQQQTLPIHHIDKPELPETFADSVHAIYWDGQTLRVELCVTRIQEVKSGTAPEVKRYPACRLVLTAPATVDLFNRLQQTIGNLVQAGVVQQ